MLYNDHHYNFLLLQSRIPGIRHLVECIVGAMVNPPKVVWDTTKRTGDECRILDMKRALKYGFQAEITLEQGVQEVMRWYAANRDVTSNRYDVFDVRG